MNKRIGAVLGVVAALLLGPAAVAAPAEPAPAGHGFASADDGIFDHGQDGHGQDDEGQDDHDHDGDGRPDHDPEDHDEDGSKDD